MKKQKKENKVYFLTDGTNIKIGFTSQPLEDRVHQLNTGSANQIRVLGYIKAEQEKERYLHKRFANFRIRSNGEWFKADQSLIEYINEHNEKPNTFIDIIDEQVVALVCLKLIR